METEAVKSYSELEEGEIENDDPDELYIPLERPHISTTVEPNPDISDYDEDDDNGFQQSSSDSEDSAKKPKFPKVRQKVSVERKTPFCKKKNYNIWCSDLQTEVLTNSLVDCNVDQLNDRSRDVESYNYRLGMQERDQYKNNSLGSDINARKRLSGKRKHNGVCVNDQTNNKPDNLHKKSEKGVSNGRNILDLAVSVNNSEEDIAKDIANKLCEEKEELILRALTILGKEPVIDLFKQTKEIEASGGMLVMNGTRRRTPGGVFFYLLKTSETLSRELINLVLAEDKKARAEEKKLIAKKMKEIRAEKFKKALSKDDFPTLLSRTELAIKEFKAKKLADDSPEVENPPPSPATE